MKRFLSAIVLLTLAAACGGPPADVGGPYQGSSSITGPPGESGGGAEFVTIIQNGSELSFTVSGCAVKAYANSSTTFAVDPFKCTKTLTTSSWELNVNEGTVSGNAASINMNMKGRAKNGSRDEPLTFTFSGSKR